MGDNTNLRLVLTGLLLAILMAAMDNTIVATALGSLANLGGVERVTAENDVVRAIDPSGTKVLLLVE